MPSSLEDKKTKRRDTKKKRSPHKRVIIAFYSHLWLFTFSHPWASGPHRGPCPRCDWPFHTFFGTNLPLSSSAPLCCFILALICETNTHALCLLLHSHWCILHGQNASQHLSTIIRANFLACWYLIVLLFFFGISSRRVSVARYWTNWAYHSSIFSCIWKIDSSSLTSSRGSPRLPPCFPLHVFAPLWRIFTLESKFTSLCTYFHLDFTSILKLLELHYPLIYTCRWFHLVYHKN